MAAKIEEAKRFLGYYDIHMGWERVHVRGHVKIRPTHDLRAIQVANAFARDFKPHIFFLGGDQLNCGPISHWNKGRPRLQEGFRLKEEMDLLDRHVLKPIEALKPNRIIWLEGNHEVWLNDFLNENPGIEGLVEPKNYLRLEERGWELYSQGEILKIGRMNVIHGDVLRNGRFGSLTAKNLVADYRRNMRAGHKHTYEVYTDVTPFDRQDYHTGILIPALAACSPAYGKNSSSNFQKGFHYGYVWPDGTFSDYVAIINKGEVTVNGKRYR